MNDKRPERLVQALLWCRRLAAAAMCPIGAIGALLSLQIHYLRSDTTWLAPRYEWERGGLFYQLFDSGLALCAGAIFFPRLAWIAVSWAARLMNRELPGGQLKTLDLLWLGGLGLLLACLVYRANF